MGKPPLCNHLLPRARNSPHIITGMREVFTFHVYALLYIGAIFSLLTPYVANKFKIHPQKHCEPFCDSTTNEESILAERVL